MKLDLEQIKAAARAATGGEWVVDRRSHEDHRLYVAQDYKGEPGGRICEVFENCLVREPERTANAELIAAMHPAVVLALVERLERAEAAVAAAEADIRRLDSGVFTITDRNDWGEEFKSEWRGMDLRAMIDEAMTVRRDDEGI